MGIINLMKLYLYCIQIYIGTHVYLKKTNITHMNLAPLRKLCTYNVQIIPFYIIWNTIHCIILNKGTINRLKG